MLDLWDKAGEQARNLSGGMKRRLMIARALIHEPRLLILDEPTAGVDIELRRSMWSFLQDINANGTTIILTTHYLEEAEQLCRNIAIIDEGRIIQNSSMRDLLAQSQQESFILDVEESVCADITLDGYTLKCIDEHSFEVSVQKGASLNDLFSQLSAQKIHITSMRNKANRLEELFVSMVQANDQAGGDA
jgi:ABC-2 type transport system ATP-binding protein